MIKYIFWDFNGTILDDRKLCWQLLNELLKEEGQKEITYSRYFEVFGFPIKEYYKKAGLTFKEKTYEEMADWFIAVYQPLSLKESLYEGVEETLQVLNNKGINNICLSASLEDNLKEQLNHFKISHYFKDILGTNNVLATGKKSVAKNYVEKNKINPKDCLLIGDTIADDQLAKSLGFKSILFTNGHQTKERLSKTGSLTIDKIDKIIKIIEKGTEL